MKKLLIKNAKFIATMDGHNIPFLQAMSIRIILFIAKMGL